MSLIVDAVQFTGGFEVNILFNHFKIWSRGSTMRKPDVMENFKT